MNWLDIILIILIVVPTLIGLKNGIVKAAFIVAGLVVGVVLASRFSTQLGEAMSFIPDPGWAKILAFAIIFIIIMVIASIAAKLVKNVLSAIMLNWINRLGGAVLGLLLGVLFCGAILSIWVQFLGAGDTVINSSMAALLLDKFPIILGLLPEEFNGVKGFFQ